MSEIQIINLNKAPERAVIFRNDSVIKGIYKDIQPIIKSMNFEDFGACIKFKLSLKDNKVLHADYIKKTINLNVKLKISYQDWADEVGCYYGELLEGFINLDFNFYWISPVWAEAFAHGKTFGASIPLSPKINNRDYPWHETQYRDLESSSELSDFILTKTISPFMKIMSEEPIYIDKIYQLIHDMTGGLNG